MAPWSFALYSLPSSVIKSQPQPRRAEKQSAPGGRARLSLDLDPATKANFEALCDRADLSLTDLIKRSVGLFDVATEHTASGGTLIFRHKDGREERLLLL